MSIQIGMNARLFPSNWRPAREEIAFAIANSFESIQFHGQQGGLDAERLGDEPATIGEMCRAGGLAPVMEIIVLVGANGRTRMGLTPLELLEANLPAINALGCTCVHWHLAPAEAMDAATRRALEEALISQLAVGAEIGRREGFRFGFEHNEPGIDLFAAPEHCAAALQAVPLLGFVCDLNHIAPEDRDAYLALAPRMSMLHVSDTPLPEVNYHLPLGLGTVDFVDTCAKLLADGFSGPAILEIGGLPKSGGYGRDTDAALVDSRGLLAMAIRSSGKTSFTHPT